VFRENNLLVQYTSKRPTSCHLLFYFTSYVLNMFRALTLCRRNYFFLILAQPVYKMWIIREPNMWALWIKLHFEEKKNEEYRACLKYSVPTFVEEIYKMLRLEVSFAVRPIYVLLGVKRLIYPSSGACDCVVELPHQSSSYVKTEDLALV